MDKNTHQYDNTSINEISETLDEPRSSFQPKRASKGRKKRVRIEFNESDSEFELPTYTTKKRVVDSKRSSKRQRKVSYKVKDYIDDESYNDIDSLNQIETSNKAEDKRLESDNPAINHVTAPTFKNKYRKISSDSTLDGYSSTKKQVNEQSKTLSAFKNVPKLQNSGSNFGYLLKAFKIYENLPLVNNEERTFGDASEERKIEGHNASYPELIQASQCSDLNFAVKLLNAQNFDYFQTGNAEMNFPNQFGNKNECL